MSKIKAQEISVAETNPITEEIATWTMFGFIEAAKTPQKAYSDAIDTVELEAGERFPTFPEVFR